MNCSMFDLSGCVTLPNWLTDAWHQAQVWGWWALGIAAALVLLTVLVRVKQLAGWPGVVAVLMAVLTLGAYGKGRIDQKAADEARKPPPPKQPSPPTVSNKPKKRVGGILGKLIGEE